VLRPDGHALADPEKPLMTPLLPIAGIMSLLVCVGSLLLLRAVRRQARVTSRLLAVATGGEKPKPRAAGGGPLRLVALIGMTLARSGLLSSGTISQLEQTLISAGLRGANGLGLFVGFKLLFLAGLPAVAWFGLQHWDLSPLVRNGGVAGAAVMGMLLPDYFVRSRRSAYLKRVQVGLADALDMMVICSEAGLGMEPAIARVATEIIHAHPAVADEMSQTVSELRVVADRRTALINMGARTGLEGLKRLGATLIQTQQYGTPLAQALRTLSAELRQEMLVRFEGRAARLPVLLTVPMIVFILPTVFIIVGGPAILGVYATMQR
jgi:tight adherence protein C